MLGAFVHRENGGSLGMVRPCLKGIYPINTGLYKVSMELIIKGPPCQGYHHFPYFLLCDKGSRYTTYMNNMPIQDSCVVCLRMFILP